MPNDQHSTPLSISAAERKRERDRAAAERRRRKKGIAAVKGTEAICARCGCSFTRSGVRAKYCAPCKPQAILERARARSQALCRARGAVKIGEPILCSHCGTPTQRRTARSKYCPECRKMQAAGKLPHLEEARLRWRQTVWRERYWSGDGTRVKALASYKTSRAKRKTNPAFTLNERMSAGVRHSLGSRKGGARWEALVGYTITDLMAHLERQFTKGMSWENRGEWHIDHVIPLSSFEFTTPDCPGFKAAWALTNLRPLWGGENIRKSARRTHLL